MSDSEPAAASSPVRAHQDDDHDNVSLNNGSTGGNDDDFDDLFGDGSEGDEEGGSGQRRHLDDERLDSGDDEGRNDRRRQSGPPSDDEVDQQYLYIGADLPRSHYPKPGDKEFYLMKIPPFLSIQPQPFTTQSLLQTTSQKPAQSSVLAPGSIFDSAISTIRWRYSPSNPTEMQSNARFVRWSDGSLTMQFASDPLTHYKVAANALAPPQQHPRKPTPVSRPGVKRVQGGYDPALDSFTYLCAPSLDVGVVRIVQKVTTGLTVAPPKSTSTAAFEQLRQSIKESNTRVGIGHADGADFQMNPELQYKQHEAAEKEKLRMKKRIENQQNKERDRSARALARSSGVRTSGYGLGGMDEMSSSARRKARKARRDDYSSDEEYGAGGRSNRRTETYDDDDDFIAESDEEAVPADNDDSDEEIPRRFSSSKRQSNGNDSDGGGRSRKKRRVIDDEDENEGDDDDDDD